MCRWFEEVVELRLKEKKKKDGDQSILFSHLHVDSSFSMLFESLSPVLISFCPGTQSMRKCVRSATWGPLGAS